MIQTLKMFFNKNDLLIDSFWLDVFDSKCFLKKFHQKLDITRWKFQQVAWDSFERNDSDLEKTTLGNTTKCANCDD